MTGGRILPDQPVAEQNQFRGLRGESRTGFLQAGGLRHFVIGSGKFYLEDDPVGRNIVHKQHIAGHWVRAFLTCPSLRIDYPCQKLRNPFQDMNLLTNSRNTADVTGLQALSWLAANDELLPVFLGATGATEQDLRDGVQDPGFLASVLDFILMDDAWVQAFCDAHDLSYDSPLRARQMLPGGQEVNWT